jgi:stage V sporulation protein AE
LRRKVILVTDGDAVAQKAVEVAARNIGGRCISRSAGNPTPLTGPEIVDLVKQTLNDPVVIMVDDCGNPGQGAGENVMKEIIHHPDIEVLGVVAIASNTSEGEGARVEYSINEKGEVTKKAVDKEGKEVSDNVVIGDTLSILDDETVPIIVGLGDPGKMNNQDLADNGAPITTAALQKILNKSGVN